MREIKFRIWDTAMEKFVGSEFLHLNWDGSIVNVFDNGRDVEDWTANKQAVLQQYTGLKDKNGVEIYEGDIVKGKRFGHDKEFHRHIGSVEWYAQRYVVNGVAKYKGWNNEELNGLYEVIGNIYEHPHLLEANHE